MTEVEKKGIGKVAIGIALCAVVIVLGAFIFYSHTTLQNQINTLNNDKDSLQGQIDSLNDDKNNLQSQIDSHQNVITGMQAADMRAMLTDYFSSSFWGTDKHRVEGYILNFGEETAYNVQIHLTWDMGGGSYVFKTIAVGNPWGHYIGRVAQDFYFGGQGTLSYYVTWD